MASVNVSPRCPACPPFPTNGNADKRKTITTTTTTTTTATTAIAEEMYCCGIRALEKLGKWPEAVSLLEQWREKGAYDADNDKMVRVNRSTSAQAHIQIHTYTCTIWLCAEL